MVLTSGYSHVLAREGPHGFELLHKPCAAEEVLRVLRQVMQGREHSIERKRLLDRLVVLVVEDEPPVRALMVDTLEDEGFEVIEASTSGQALKVLRLRRTRLIGR